MILEEAGRIAATLMVLKEFLGIKISSVRLKKKTIANNRISTLLKTSFPISKLYKNSCKTPGMNNEKFSNHRSYSIKSKIYQTAMI